MSGKPHAAVWLDRGDGPFALNDGHRAALTLAAGNGGTATAFLAASRDEPVGAAITLECGRYGAGSLVALRMDEGAVRNPEALAAAFVRALGELPAAPGPVTDILATSNAAGRDFMARVASTLGAPLLQDCVGVNFAAATGEKYILQGRTCGVYSLPGALRCWTLRPHEFPCRAGDAPAPAPIVFVDVPAVRPAVRPSSAVRDEGGEGDELARLWNGQPDIMEASIIIGGGRSLESAENFRLLHEAAAPLHAAVGASRSAVDMGYAPPFVQIGQTGVVVSPELYIACGISGSIFHTTGLKGARTVAAVNKDPAAQIFLRADYGITDDLFEVLPLLQREFEKSP